MSVAAAAAVVVGLVFVVAAGSKLAGRERWVAQATDMGAPPIVIPALPWVELAIGAALITGLARRAAAIAAIALLVAFTALIVVRLRQGRRPVCACFGAWSAKPIGAGHLVRNGVLVVVAGLAAL